MRISDWSSDVCSSDLGRGDPPRRSRGPAQAGPGGAGRTDRARPRRNGGAVKSRHFPRPWFLAAALLLAACGEPPAPPVTETVVPGPLDRKSVVQGKGV